jgi:hypothetical protein
MLQFAMGVERTIVGALIALLAGTAQPAVAAPGEPLIVTQLPDPDPYYVPPAEHSSGARKVASGQRDSALDAAMEQFGRAIGQATRLQQQAIDARCRSGVPASAGTSERFAWEASCRYSRH